MSPFVRDYLEGRTPIPCARCNTEVKFASLVDKTRALGVEHVATGHYARKDLDPATGRYTNTSKGAIFRVGLAYYW